ncbi:hypothetical protein K1T71_011961 [Dendrolimus kikuchii]|uniref:Uncharacterized protein n=1 Tax=Dendrolimus kikuchii TaxID=765133 RepID=A0ACC1CMV3_9NEOP|nr:hypothetical protein K1T71_011961 [Dendrolimus kikuchii]
MSKRFIPQEYGERKKPKLDVNVSNHKFPSSQSNDNNKVTEEDNWGNDDDDEILLLASQACEDAQIIGSLPDYSLCMQPQSTSTQYNQPGPSGSTEFNFKKPTATTSSLISTNLKEKCNRISSPLPGITSKLVQNNHHIDLSDDFIFNDKIFKQDTDSLCRQLLQLKEENAKLKSENGKLMDKCVTKEGEASILRSQLRSSQVAVDNARLETIKARERIQTEYMEKEDKVNRVINDLKTELDFKNSEIMSIKQKYKILESSKVKLTQVTVGSNDNSTRLRVNNSSIRANDSSIFQNKRVKTISSAIQTLDKSHLLILTRTKQPGTTCLKSILPHILQATPNQHYSILDYNEKLQKHTDLSQNKCRVYSTFHRIPSTPAQKEDRQNHVEISCIYEDVSSMAMGCDNVREKCFSVFSTIHSVLTEVQTRLEKISERISPAFQKEMDERYIEATSSFQDINKKDLLKGRILYKEEQEILARRMTAIMAYILDHSRSKNILEKYEEFCMKQNRGTLIHLLASICSLIDSTSCATIYSGLLLSITILIETQISSATNPVLFDILKSCITSRPASFVCCHLLALVTKLSNVDGFKNTLCPGNGGNLKMDYDQGVLLYKRDSCYIQILVRQIEACLKCIENQNLRVKAIETTRNLIKLYNNTNSDGVSLSQSKRSCDCQLLLVQVTVYALRICAVMLGESQKSHELGYCSDGLLPVCRCGVQVIYRCVQRDAEFSSQLSHNEGHLIEFCEIMKDVDNSEIYATMLSEITGTLQSSPDDTTPSINKQLWIDSFMNCTISD